MNEKLLVNARKVLSDNDRGSYTVPNGQLYPHQWLWDSCFIAIGLSHLDVGRAQTEIESLLRGQWFDGMLPHIIFSDDKPSWVHRHEQAWFSEKAPTGVITSGITQPPLLAEAVWLIGKKLKTIERRAWFKQILPRLIAYHQWIYKERCRQGLAIVVHPYETGMDSSPTHLAQIRLYAWPLWLKLFQACRLESLTDMVRRDTKYVASDQRMSSAEAIAYWSLMRRLKRLDFDSKKILRRPRYAVFDVAFNSILVRANECLAGIAKVAGKALPDELIQNVELTKKSFDGLWDESAGQYYSRSAISGELIAETTIASLLPLYSGSIDRERATHLVELLKKRGQFKTSWPVPSVPESSSSFEAKRYWQGPVWINMNWLLIDGLERYGFNEEADGLKQKTIQLLTKSGSSEYFNPLNGAALGAKDFSWTAALAIDLLKD